MQRRYTGVNNGASIYWKTSKPMADGSSAHIRDSRIARIHNLVPGYGSGDGHMMGPSGPFTFLLDNLTFIRAEGDTSSPLIKIGQHCGLSGHNGGVEGQGCRQLAHELRDGACTPPPRLPASR